MRGFWSSSALVLLAGCNRATPPAAETSEPRVFVEAPEPIKVATRTPQLAGVSPEWAEQMLRLKKLNGVRGRLYLASDEWPGSLPEGSVYLQTPQSATLSQTGATVAVWTAHRASPDNPSTRVPEVIGKTLDEAENLVRDAGFDLMTVYRSPGKKERADEGVVLEQYPRGSKSAGRSSTVLVHVARPSSPAPSSPAADN